MRRKVLTAVSQAGIEAQDIPSEALLNAFRQAGPFNGLIYELGLQPGADVEFLRSILDMEPDMPVLVYAPVEPGVDDALNQIAALPRVHVMLQFENRHEELRLQDRLRQLAQNHPVRLLESVVTALLPGICPRAKAFARCALEQMRGGRYGRPPSVAAVAQQLELSVRTLERAWDHQTLPPPGEFLGWLTMLYLAYTAESGGLPTVAVARRLGIEPHRMYRLRHRLLSANARAAIREDAKELTVVLLEFSARCGISEEKATSLFLKRAL